MRSRTPEEVATALVDAERQLALGQDLADITAGMGVSVSTYYRWRRRFEGMTTGGVARIRDLERENTRLRRLVVDRDLELETLREISRGSY